MTQFIRKCGLIVYGTPPTPGGTGLAAPAAPGDLPAYSAPVIPKSQSAQGQPGIDLSNMRIIFQVHAMDTDTPPTAVIRVLNLAETTVQKIKKEFQGVSLQAGYVNGDYGVIFQGSIIRVRSGRISNKDTFVDILASNLDAIYNFGVVNKTLKAGATLQDRLKAIQQSVNASQAASAGPSAFQQGLQYGNIPSSFNTGGTLPRGKVLFGLARDHMTNVADTGGTTWSVGPDGKVNFYPLDNYPQSEAVVLNSQSGLIKIPEATQQGIEVKCLLNPMIKLGTRLQIDNASINTTINKSPIGFPAYADFQFFANTSNDGFYKSIVVEHFGDTRGEGDEDWRSEIIALAIDPSSGASPVAAYG